MGRPSDHPWPASPGPVVRSGGDEEYVRSSEGEDDDDDYDVAVGVDAGDRLE